MSHLRGYTAVVLSLENVLKSYVSLFLNSLLLSRVLGVIQYECLFSVLFALVFELLRNVPTAN